MFCFVCICLVADLYSLAGDVDGDGDMDWGGHLDPFGTILRSFQEHFRTPYAPKVYFSTQNNFP